MYVEVLILQVFRHYFYDDINFLKISFKIVRAIAEVVTSGS